MKRSPWFAAGVVGVAFVAVSALGACQVASSAEDEYTGQPASEALERLQVVTDWRPNTYSRNAFGQPWADVDGNGCDTRNDILAGSLSNIRQTDHCRITSGRLQDPYTGTEIEFRIGGDPDVDIDHVVSLANAWYTGAEDLSADRRRKFANDPLNLLAVDAGANREKGAESASGWLPVAAFRCEFVARQIAVKTTYRLGVRPGEVKAMTEVLSDCPDQRLPSPVSVRPTQTEIR